MPANDPGSALLASVRSTFPPSAGFVLEEARTRRWESATFAGARHEMAFRLEGDGADNAASRFFDKLDRPASFALPGHLLADITLVSEERRPGEARIRIEALTVEEA